MVSKSQIISLLIIPLMLFTNQGCVGTTSNTSSILTDTPFPKPTERLDLSQMHSEEWASTSPDGTWIAIGLVAFPKENTSAQLAYVRLMIFSADGKTHWTVIDKWEELGLGFPIPAPLKWSQNGKHFYFTYRVTPDGCSALPFLTDLQQVNLENGIASDLLPDPALALALSPDDSRVAYFGRDLVLKNLVTGEDRETKIDQGKDFNVGNILWAPDGRAFVLTLAINPCTGPYGVSKTVWAESTTILWIDAETLQQKILVDEDPRLFITTEWNQPQKITIMDGKESSLWELDVNTGEINR